MEILKIILYIILFIGISLQGWIIKSLKEDISKLKGER